MGGGAALWLWSAAALAAPPAAPAAPRCKAAYNLAGQRARAGHLLEARDLMASCAKRVCGKAVHRACLDGYTQLDSEDIPSVVPRVTDSTGAPQTGVQVTMDGQVLTSDLDGMSIPIDPGLHEFSFTVSGKAISTQKVMIMEGTHNRVVSVAIPAAGGPAVATTEPAPADETLDQDTTPAQRRPSEEHGSPVPFVFASAGVLGLTATALTFYLSDQHNTQDSTSTAVSISVGAVVAAAVVGIWYFTSPPSKPKHTRTALAPTYGVDVRPNGSTLATISGVF